MKKTRQKWPTPTNQNAKHSAATDWEKENRPNHLHVLVADETNGQLNPTWVEALMGFPISWTDISEED